MSRTMTALLAVFLCALLALAIAPSALSAPPGASQVPAGWTKIATGGLGNPQTLMMFPFVEFSGKIYSWVPGMGNGPGIPPAPLWAYDGERFTRAAADGFGIADNVGVTPGAVFQGKLYVGTSNFTTGAQLWRSSDGSHWERVGQTLFTTQSDFNCWPMGVQDGKLIIGFDNYDLGCRVWSYDGTNFARANVDGFGVLAGGFSSSVFFDGRIHVIVTRRGEQGGTAPLMALAYNGGTSWTPTGPEGFGDPSNTASHVIFADGPYIYTGTDNVNGGQVWRYDGTAWSKVDIGAISNPQNNLVLAFPWRGQLYVSASYQNNNPPQGPAQMYLRRPDGTFETVTADGFSDPANGIVFPGAVFDGQLLAGTFNTNGFQVWAKQVGPSITSISPTSGPFGAIVTVEGTGFGVLAASGGTAEASFVDFGGARTYASDAISWTDVEIRVNVPEAAEAGPVTVTTPAGTSNGIGFQPTLSKTFYFAEGSTRDNVADGTFDEWLCLMNPCDAAATVDVTYMLAAGEPWVETYQVPPRARVTVDVEGDVGPEQDVSVMVESDRYLVAERSMYFDYHNKWSGGDVVVGASAPAPRWYFAEGTTRRNDRDGSFEEWLCIMNPSDAPAQASISYLVEWPDGTGGAPPVTVDVTVPPKSRITRDVSQDVGTDKDVSASVSSSVPVVVERPMYFDYHGAWQGGDTALGATSAAQRIDFAEGCTYGWADEWLCLANPGGMDATATVTYRIGGGIEGTQSVVVPALARKTVRVADASGLDKDVSVSVSSDHPLFAERSLYFDYGSRSWSGGTLATGQQKARETYYFAEGSTRQNPTDGWYDEWITIENPNDSTVNVKMTFLKEGGVTIVQTVQVQPKTRGTISVNSVLGPGVDAGLVLEASAPVVVERPMYFDYRGFAEGGSVSRGYSI